LKIHLQRVHLDIQVGEHAIDYANVAQKEKLSELQLRIRQLLDQVGQITKEQNYQRVRNKIYSCYIEKHHNYCEYKKKMLLCKNIDNFSVSRRAL
jgi:hypothetical protein